MSYDLHEAFCLDSFQDSLLFWDDFEGDSLKDLWRDTGDAGGSAVVVDAQDGGIVRITTDGDANDDYLIDWGTIRTLLYSKKVTLEIKAKLTQTANTYAFFSLHFDGSNEIRFQYKSDVNANWQCLCVDGGATTTITTGDAADTDYHIFRIECFPTGEVHFFIDDVECTNSPITTNIPDDAGDYFEPWLWIRTLENATKSMDIDYVYVRQDR